MDNAIYASLTRQSGLMREMQVIANNIANADTNGFRREGVVFAEYLAPTGRGRDALSMGHAHGRVVDLGQAGMTRTGGVWDLAIDGAGFFAVETPEGTRITRAGAFMPTPEGELITPDGYRLLDEGQTPVTIPPGAAVIAVGSDGTISADGGQVGRIGIFAPPPPELMTRAAGTLFAAPAVLEPAPEAGIRQGYLESSNVNPIAEVTRMIEVQRAFEMGQALMDREDRRIRDTISALTR
ncbi:MAG: flagellar hook-basal body complex protein [Paracoccus sp. (in: a-proteobacteria)]|nr:flagellar hook-basal body complex protein [Paracoccus sp. (in: a-proteobacteria)]